MKSDVRLPSRELCWVIGRGHYASRAGNLDSGGTVCANHHRSHQHSAACSRQTLDRARRLPDYTCVQTVTRKYYRHPRLRVEPERYECDQLIAQRDKRNYKVELSAIDRIRLDVKVSGAVEIGSWAGAARFDSRSVLDLARGSYQSGVMGPLLGDVFFNEATEFRYTGPDQSDSAELLAYTFQVDAGESHYFARQVQPRLVRGWEPRGSHRAVCCWISRAKVTSRVFSDPCWRIFFS